MFVEQNSYNWWTKGLPGVGVVKIICDSDSSGWKSFRLHSPGSAPSKFYLLWCRL